MYLLFLFIVALDQISKKLFVSHFQTFSSELVLVKNTGIAFGFFPHNTSLIIILNVLLLISLFVFRKHFFHNNLSHKLSLAFILAGGTGNLIDRIFLGFVVDFIRVPFIPVFNIADMAINIGLLFLIIGWIKHGKN